ncbi:MAG TPA: glycogen synthase GlgA [Acetobacteraceae bacterium]|nr:glycogen synthase GlgA [Acetobacteraceae bacterium]
MTAVTVLAVASEVFPLIKTGGLADVVGALPPALVAEGIHTTTLIPGYPAVLRGLVDAAPVHRFADLFGGEARLLRGRAAGLDLLAIDAPHLYARPGSPYAEPGGRDWGDNATRFAALGNVAAQLAGGTVAGIAPGGAFDILHAHDWQAGLALAYLQYRGGRRPGTVMTVHNLAFQGRFPAATLPALGLPPGAFSIDGVEFYGDISFLKAGLWFADRITTVSPTYAAEIRSPEGGMGFDGLLRARAAVLHGILNGIDETVWNPAADPLIVADFSVTRLERRATNKASVQAWFGLEAAPDALLFGVISRLTWQKGVDLLLDRLDELLRLGAQLVVLGSGEPGLEAGFAAAAAAHPGRIGCAIGYDEALAHQIQAGADALLMPSRFEPCGLTQLCALRYGALPVVARVGGLADTVIDANEAALVAGTGSGMQFAPVTREMLEAAMQRTAALWRQKAAWRRLQHNAMRTDVSWRRPAARYAALFRSLLAERVG